MKKQMVTAVFPLRGQPPHIGHIITIVNIYDDYDKIILYVLDNPGKYHSPKEFIMPPEEVANIFKKIFKHMPKIEVIIGSKHFRDATSFDGLPEFDILVTGNEDLIKGLKIKIPVRFVPRSTIHGYDINGTLLRNLMRDQLKE